MTNIDIGRPLTYADIVDDSTYPIDERDVGVFCYYCKDGSELEPLTQSTGVFTSLVTCDDNAPVWLCLEHVPLKEREFDAFSEDLQATLHSLRRAAGRG